MASLATHHTSLFSLIYYSVAVISLEASICLMTCTETEFTFIIFDTIYRSIVIRSFRVKSSNLFSIRILKYVLSLFRCILRFALFRFEEVTFILSVFLSHEEVARSLLVEKIILVRFRFCAVKFNFLLRNYSRLTNFVAT